MRPIIIVVLAQRAAEPWPLNEALRAGIALQALETAGFKALDALHLAAAEVLCKQSFVAFYYRRTACHPEPQRRVSLGFEQEILRFAQNDKMGWQKHRGTFFTKYSLLC